MICKCCGKKEAISQGLCMTCYSRKRYAEKLSVYKGERKLGDKSKSILREYSFGEKQSDIARKLGCSRQFVSKVIKREKEFAESVDKALRR